MPKRKTTARRPRSKKGEIPNICCHKPNSSAYMVVGGQRFYLGKYGYAETVSFFHHFPDAIGSFLEERQKLMSGPAENLHGSLRLQRFIPHLADTFRNSPKLIRFAHSFEIAKLKPQLGQRLRSSSSQKKAKKPEKQEP